VLVRRPAILTEAFRGISQSLHANTGIYSYLNLGHNLFLRRPFQIIHHLSSYHAMLSSPSYRQQETELLSYMRLVIST
jgi:hypothetical protein